MVVIAEHGDGAEPWRAGRPAARTASAKNDRGSKPGVSLMKSPATKTMSGRSAFDLLRRSAPAAAGGHARPGDVKIGQSAGARTGGAAAGQPGSADSALAHRRVGGSRSSRTSPSKAQDERDHEQQEAS